MSNFVTYPQLEHQVVHLYYRKRKNNRYYVKYVDYTFNNQGILCHCDMAWTREDYYKHWLQNNVHNCQPGDPVV